MAFRAACMQGALWGAVAVSVLVAIALSNQTAEPAAALILKLAPVLLVLGAVPSLLLVRRSGTALAIAAGLSGAGAGLVFLGGPSLAIAAGMMAVTGPLLVALVTAWGPLRAGQVWARAGAACAAVGVAAPALVLAIAASHGAGLVAGLSDMGEAMGWEAPLGPGNCPIGGGGCRTAPGTYMTPVAAAVAAGLSVSLIAAVGALVRTRAWRPNAVPEVF